MESLLKADIFFFVTTIAVVLLSGAVLVAVYYVVRLVRVMQELVEVVRDESKRITEDIDGVRTKVRANAEMVGAIVNAVAGGAVKKATATKSKKKQTRKPEK